MPLTANYHMHRYGVEYQDLGSDHFDRRDRAKLAKRLSRRLEERGPQVKVEPAAA
jgi:hypothetical protein